MSSRHHHYKQQPKPARRSCCLCCSRATWQKTPSSEEEEEGERRMRERNKYVVLLAVERETGDPSRELRRSMREVIAAAGITEVQDLRGLLECYVAVNGREQRRVVLEAFLEVCAGLFVSHRRQRGRDMHIHVERERRNRCGS